MSGSEPVPERVAGEVESKDEERDGQTGEQRQVRRVEEMRPAGVEVSPVLKLLVPVMIGDGFFGMTPFGELGSSSHQMASMKNGVSLCRCTMFSFCMSS